MNSEINRKKIFGRNIKAERMRYDITQELFAEKIKISTDSMSRIERGLQVPSAFVLYDIAKVLNIDINELFKNFD